MLGELAPGNAIASLGYPDILCPPHVLAKWVGDRKFSYRPDSKAICKRHGVPQHQVPDAHSLFESYGATLDVFDIQQERGCEQILDLNHPIPGELCERFDYVLDVGTLEHCFNAPQALVNMAAMVKVGGIVIHENPFNVGNHGFWGLNPTLFYDFYGDNGFQVLECSLIDQEGFYEVGTQRFKHTAGEANVLTLAQRLAVKPVVFPTQSKYRKKT